MPYDWTQFLQTYGGGERPPIMEARDWLRGGVSEKDAWDNEQRADNLLWMAQELGYADQETLDKVACELVSRVATIAPDVVDITACYSKPGGRIAAYHERLAVEAIEAERLAKLDEAISDMDKELALLDVVEKLEGPLVNIADTAEVAGASQARFAASCIVDCDCVKAATFSLKAKASEAQHAYCAAMADPVATDIEKQMLSGARDRVIRLESKEQCDLVRRLIGRPE
jgi:hypothetical protein